MSFPRSRLREALVSLRRTLAIGLAVGVTLRLSGLMPSLGQAVAVCLIFTALIVGGFQVARPWVEWHPDNERSPFRQALGNLLRVLALYSLLLFLGAVLVRRGLGLDLFAQKADALLTYFIGLTITSVISGLHMAESLVGVERAQRRAEAETFRLRLLEADHARKTLELEEARQLQLSMLPRMPPAWGGLRVAHLLETATEVGGDTYDYRLLADGSLLVAFGDATGHGLQAGLIVTAVKALFHTLPEAATLPEAMDLLSQGVRGLQLPRMAMAMTLLRLHGRQVRLCNAGMPPVHHDQGGELATHRASGPPLGQLKRFTYAEASLTLAAGEALVLCSDGFPECLDPEDRMLGYDRLPALVQRHGPAEAPEARLRGLAEEAHAWSQGRPLADDMSFLILAQPCST